MQAYRRAALGQGFLQQYVSAQAAAAEPAILKLSAGSQGNGSSNSGE